MTSLTKHESWKQLARYSEAFQESYQSNRHQPIEPSLSKKWRCSTDTVTLDYSNQFLDNRVLELLFNLADDCELPKKIRALITGELVNTSEHKPALHTALRTQGDEKILVNGHNIVPDILQAREQMRVISNQIRQGEWVGYSGKPITDVVNLGIGGSLLGPQFCTSALSELTLPTLRYHFICSIDPNEFHNVVSKLNPETTLFIVASKSFDTKETLANMARAIAWINQPNHLDKHLIAVTANVKKAKQVGIRHIIPIWNWVGGRYSACSSINLITCIAIGFERFSDLLSGAHAMDQHFLHQPFSQNLPVLLALLGIWNINFLNIPSLLILVYSLPLQLLVPYLQQLDMESNGKSRDLENRRVDYATGPIVWGGPADQVQHSYLQLVCQGTHRVTADIISVEGPKEDLNHQLAQAHQDVLSQTIGEDQGSQQVSISKTPMNHVSLRACSPEAIGALMALYEHKIFTQSVIWHINAFDQPGVDHLKHLID